jgi:hypothetical protein
MISPFVHSAQPSSSDLVAPLSRLSAAALGLKTPRTCSPLELTLITNPAT